MCRYNPKIDLVFRKLFGSEENKDILLSFVNAVLEKEVKIKDLTIKNPYNISSYITGKTSILDIKAVDEHDRWYDIEMQIAEQGFYGKRALYYWGKVFTDQVEKAEKLSDLRKTIGIHLLDFNYFRDERYLRRVVLKDFDTNDLYQELDYEELYFLEMSKFKKDYRDLKTVLDRWITFMNRAYELERGKVPEELRQEKEILRAIEKLEIMYFDPAEKEIYEAERKLRMDHQEEVRTAQEKGRKEGRMEGIKEEKIKIAKSLLELLDVKTISEKTGLSAAEIEELK